VGLWQRELSAMALLLPLYMVLLGFLAIGVGWIVASLQVYIRDTSQLLAVVMTFWFWLTPILISEQQVPDRLRFLIKLNPLAYLVRAYRERLLSYRPPSLSDFAVLTAFALVAFVTGGLFFRHLRRGFADVL